MNRRFSFSSSINRHSIAPIPLRRSSCTWARSFRWWSDFGARTFCCRYTSDTAATCSRRTLGTSYTRLGSETKKANDFVVLLLFKSINYHLRVVHFIKWCNIRRHLRTKASYIVNFLKIHFFLLIIRYLAKKKNKMLICWDQNEVSNFDRAGS